MDSGEAKTISDIAEVTDAEDIPSSDDPTFGTSDSKQNHVLSVAKIENDSNNEESVDDAIEQNHVFVTTSQGLLSANDLPSVQESARIKTTHFVIHDHSLSVDDATENGLKTPTTPLPPPTPSTPLSRERGFKYQWDASAFEAILPVRCKSTNGELHKSRFGSGGRGRCIRVGDKWFTPSEFEGMSGRASSKDWKRSIRFGGRTLHCLIEDEILNPHATSCTCAACCDDESVTGPIRLFVPYKRRKKDSDAGLQTTRKKSLVSVSKTPSQDDPSSSPSKESGGLVWKTLSAAGGGDSVVLGSNVLTQGETIQIISTDPAGNLTVEPSIVMSPLEQNGKPPSPNNIEEGSAWWQLEEMATSLVNQAKQLRHFITQCKQESENAHQQQLQQLRTQLEKEKIEAINAVRIEAQINLSRALIEERAQKDIAIQQALAQARAEKQTAQPTESVALVTDGKHTYNVTWIAQTDAVTGNIPSAFLGSADVVDCDEEEEKEKE